MDLNGRKKKRFSFGLNYAIAGLLYGIKQERNFKIHFIAFVLIIVSAIFFKLSKVEWLAILIISGMVMQAELFNSAVEQIIDYIKPEMHPKAKIIKDVAAGAVLVTAIIALIIGVIIFLPKIIYLISSLS